MSTEVRHEAKWSACAKVDMALDCRARVPVTAVFKVMRAKGTGRPIQGQHPLHPVHLSRAIHKRVGMALNYCV